MSSDIDLEAIASRTVVYRIPAIDDVVVRDRTFRASDGTGQPMTVYYPRDASRGTVAPAAVIVTGYADAGMRRMFGRPAKDLGTNVSWARLIAASGVIAITYANVDPVADAAAVLDEIHANGAEMGIDSDRLGIWSCSGNVPNALSLLAHAERACVRCAALLYGYMLDLHGSTIVADMAQTFRYTNAASGKQVADLADVPMLVVRAGQDETPGLNGTIDAFVAEALRLNRRISLVNHASAPHAFDAIDHTAESRHVVRSVVAFLRDNLLAEAGG